MTEPNVIPLVTPDVGAEGAPIRVVQWLVDPGIEFAAGDRIVELLAEGVVVHVSSPRPGRLHRIEQTRGHQVEPGETLGWIIPLPVE